MTRSGGRIGASKEPGRRREPFMCRDGPGVQSRARPRARVALGVHACGTSSTSDPADLLAIRPWFLAVAYVGSMPLRR